MNEKQLRKLYHEIATARHQELNAQMAKAAKVNPEFTDLATDTSYDCSGDINVSAILIRTSVSISDMVFSSQNNQCLDFNGSGWGIGLGATGASVGSGTFNVTPDYLLKQSKIKMQVFFFTVGIGGVEVTFWNSTASTYLGVFYGGNLGLGAASSGGDGKFKSC